MQMGIQLITVQDSRAYLASYHLTVVGQPELKRVLSGNGSALRRHRPLRTVRATFTAHGSSLDKGAFRHPAPSRY